jgi:PAS domain S-box-containing protein
MVSINRAHVGVLFLAEADTGELRPAATYGLDSIADHITSPADVGEGFVSQIAHERRSRSITDIATDKRTVGSMLRATNARAVIGVPLIDADDRLLGVAVVGLLVEHRFTATEVARIEALAMRASAVLQAAVGIDERETALHTATEAKRWLEHVIAAMPEAVVLAMPPGGRVVAENQAAVERLGHLTGPELAGDITKRLFLPEGDPLDEESCPIQRAFRTGEVISGVELVALGPNGTRMPVLVSAAPVRENDGPVVAVVAVFRDIAALKEASRLKDEFVSVVSHELRSPLTPIRGFVQLVARDLAREGGHDSQVSRLSSIAGHVDRMTRLVDDLLDVSRLKSGSMEIRLSATDLGELCGDVIRDRTSTVTTHRFVYDRPSEFVIGDWDGDRLYQVIDNLVGNAIKYSPPGGTVTVSAGVDHRDGAAIVTVADDGPGIAAADRERIFSAFYRTSEAAASQIAGLGLGLYICHELVAAHGGSIEVGEAIGGGAAMTVRLPRITQAVAA